MTDKKEDGRDNNVTVDQENPVPERKQLAGFRAEEGEFGMSAPAMNQAALSPMVAMAMNPDIDLERVREVIAIQRDIQREQSKVEFAAAFAKFQAEMPSIEKDGHVHYEGAKGVTDYRHATLGSILSTVRPAMGKHGLSISWDIQEADGMITVTAELLHEGGYARINIMDGPADTSGGKNMIQAKGSTISYLQRYTLMGIIGAGAEDDDGRGADIPLTVDRISDKQQKEIREILASKGLDDAHAIAKMQKKQLRIESIEEIPESNYQSVLAWAKAQKAAA